MVKSTKFYQQLVRRRRMLAQLAESREPASPPMGGDAEKPKTRKSNSKS
mgnify:FL=1